MDYNQSQPNDYNRNQPYYGQSKPNTMAVASFVLGILALLTLCTIYFPIVFGSLSILFALLSKGYGKKFHTSVVVSMISSSLCIFLAIAAIVTTLSIVFTNPTVYQEYKSQLNTIFEQQYGVTYDEWFENYEQQLLPFDTNQQ